MKINPLNEAYRYQSLVQKKEDADGQSQGRQRNSQDEKGKGDPGEGDDSRRNQPGFGQEIQAAVDAFSGETEAQANGLSAVAVGQGPGLKVILKDGSGAVVRQLTGEEFLKLREAASLHASPRGKILDQKL